LNKDLATLTTKLYDVNPLAEGTLTTKKNIYINFAFNSVIVDLDSLELGEKRLLEVDNRLVLSTNLTTRFLVSSVDVLHAFAVPELGLKIDAVPGRLNQILVFINRPGVYYGQCSELCGTNHGFMPIVVQAVKPSDYLKYIEKIKNSL
jgi:heme/copper-type cytochrome/quinol oxidase subunit 2